MKAGMAKILVWIEQDKEILKETTSKTQDLQTDPIGTPFPLKCREQLDNIENMLGNKKNMQKMVSLVI